MIKNSFFIIAALMFSGIMYGASSSDVGSCSEELARSGKASKKIRQNQNLQNQQIRDRRKKNQQVIVTARFKRGEVLGRVVSEVVVTNPKKDAGHAVNIQQEVHSRLAKMGLKIPKKIRKKIERQIVNKFMKQATQNDTVKSIKRNLPVMMLKVMMGMQRKIDRFNAP